MRIGILLGAMPRMLHEIVSTVFDAESDLDVVADGVFPIALVPNSALAVFGSRRRLR